MDRHESDAAAIGFWMEEAKKARGKAIDEILSWLDEHWEFGSAGLYHGCRVAILVDLIAKLESMKGKE